MNCPCDSALPYVQCCQPLHQGMAAQHAQALMRSRYSAYVLNLNDYLMATWHPSTRPSSLQTEQGLKWLGLRINRAWQNTPNEAFVDFTARYKVGGQRAERLHEVSRFVFEDNHWFYVDGVLDDES
ncbi:MAG: YchJ family protein [Formosimonas sp.]